jgi:cytochrome P450
LDLGRRGAGQLTLGAGPHSCVGASLIRRAAVAVTRPLVESFAAAVLAGCVDWHGGSSFRSPRHLPVRLSRDGGSTAVS